MSYSRTRTTKYSLPAKVIMYQNSGTNSLPKVNCISTCTDETHPGPPYKSGGPLSILKSNFGRSISSHTEMSYGATWRRGSFYVSPHTTTNPLSNIALAGWGSKGFNRGMPVHPEMDLGVAVGEMKDFPNMIRRTKDFFGQFRRSGWSGLSRKDWADAYLNHQFGWRPFLNDFHAILDMQSRLAARIAWLKANNGKDVKREFTLASGSTRSMVSTQDSTSPLQPVLNTAYYSTDVKDRGNISVFKTDSYRIWFSGCFTFLIPPLQFMPGYDSLLKAKLMGAVPDMRLVYNLTPWSWLVDWFISAGDVVDNVTLMQQFNQVARYAYVMASQETRYDTYGWQRVYVGTSFQNRRLTLVSASAVAKFTTKQRSEASPYGFGLTWDGFNPYQLSVLAALGISRGKGSL